MLVTFNLLSLRWTEHNHDEDDDDNDVDYNVVADNIGSSFQLSKLNQ